MATGCGRSVADTMLSLKEESIVEYRISYVGDGNVSDIHHIKVDYNGNCYNIIFGKYINGGFFSIPNWNVGGELATFDDVFWNTESISKVIKSKRVGKVIATAIAQFME